MTECLQTTPPEKVPITVRTARPTDLAALVSIERRCFAIPWSEESLANELSGSDRSIILAAVTTEDRVVGYVGCWFVYDEGQINNIAVDPDWRCRGIGSLLLDALFTLGRQTGIRSYTLEVRTSNEAALILYRRFGFVAQGLRRAYYTDNGEDAIIMLKNAD